MSSNHGYTTAMADKAKCVRNHRPPILCIGKAPIHVRVHLIHANFMINIMLTQPSSYWLLCMLMGLGWVLRPNSYILSVNLCLSARGSFTYYIGKMFHILTIPPWPSASLHTNIWFALASAISNPFSSHRMDIICQRVLNEMAYNHDNGMIVSHHIDRGYSSNVAAKHFSRIENIVD